VDEIIMKLKVTDKGVTVPKTYLEGIEEVEIKKDNGIILLIPISDTDPNQGLGKNPVSCGVRDASNKHDKYIY